MKLSASPQDAYANDALPKAKTLAECLSTVLSRDHSVSRMLEDLIHTLADVLDPRGVFTSVARKPSIQTMLTTFQCAPLSSSTGVTHLTMRPASA